MNKAKLLEKIIQVYQEHSTPNWDSYDALPISEDHYNQTVRLVEMLPGDLPQANVAALSDGSMELDWTNTNNGYKTFDLGAHHDGKFMWYYYNNGESKHGTALYHDGLSPEMLDLIKKIYG